MTDGQNYHKKKNTLIIVCLVLLVVFVGLMCYILIYAKMNPPKEFISPDDIEIITMNTVDYTPIEMPRYNIVAPNNEIMIMGADKPLNLKLTEEKTIKINETDEILKIMENEEDINSNIKAIYQLQVVDAYLILTEEADLYRTIDSNINEGTVFAEKIPTDSKVADIITINNIADNIFMLYEDGRMVNLNTLKEYNGVINELKTQTSTIYIYEDYSFGLEEGKIFVDQNNEIIQLNISFDNKIIAKNNVIYEINGINNTISTSKLGIFEKVWYNFKDNDSMYDVAVLSNTGMNEFRSSYYYTK